MMSHTNWSWLFLAYSDKHNFSLIFDTFLKNKNNMVCIGNYLLLCGYDCL